MMLLALLAAAQVVNPSISSGTVDTSNLATKADAQAAANAAAQAKAAADAARAAVPAPCTTMPSADTYTGRVGTATPCTPAADAARATQVQTANAVTMSDGSFSGSWVTAFTSAPTYAHAEINSGTTPFVCQITTQTVTAYAGKCFQVTSTTLPGTLLALGGLVVSPIASATAGQAVKVIARQ